MTSVYEAMTQKTDEIDINGDGEAKGALRIVKGALGEGLNYYLAYNKNIVTMSDNVDYDEFVYYEQRVRERQKISNVNILLHAAENDDENTTDISCSKNRIIFGAPGTGKSHKLEENSKYFADNMERVTFHPNYSYANFVGAYKPIMSKSDVYDNLDTEKRRVLAVLQDKSMSAQEKYDELYDKFKDEGLTRLPLLLGIYTDENFKTRKVDGSDAAGDNSVERNHGRAIRPYLSLNPQNKNKEISYEFVPGPFMRIYVQAINHPEEDYLLLIEEINAVLQDMANRQGLDENIYYQLFVEIILVGIKEFERYRQNIVRKINAKNQVEGQKATPISDRVLNRPTSVSGLTKEEAKQLATEIKSYKKEGKQYQKDKEAVEARYKYDVRILNVLATTGLKASSIAHEMKNDRNAIYDNYNNIVDALKEYGMWDELNSSEKTRKSYKNVPYLLESNDVVGKKLVTFMDTMLEEIEKKQFEIRYQSIADILTVIKKVWERDYAWLSIEIIMDEDIVYQISEDILQVIFDNLILNSVQQNENTQKLMITISINETNGFLNIKYCDNGKGLDDKYKTDPMKILEVHETTRTNGHGLGMWIVNNTCTMSGGEIQKICGEKGFEIEFTIGGKI